MSQIATFFCFVLFFHYNVRMKAEYITLKVIRISPTEYPHLSDRLKFAMALRDMSSTQLAARIFLSHNTISGYRSGTRTPNIETLRNIARELRVSTDFLLGLVDYVRI